MQASVTLKDICNIGAYAPESFVLGQGCIENLHPPQVLLPLEIDLAKSSSPAIKRELFIIYKERDAQKLEILT